MRTARILRRQTLESFDYQWKCLPDGDAMPSDFWFRQNLPEILEQLTALPPEWFRGKSVLDAGCGQGRWSYGMLTLGAKVTALDLSAPGLDRTRALCAGLPGLECIRGDILDPPRDMDGRLYDLVFSFGVLHHTGDTWRALASVARMVGGTGHIFLYLYGKRSWTPRKRLRLTIARLWLSAFSCEKRAEIIQRKYPALDPHQAFDLLSPTINHRVTFDDVERRLKRLGFPRIVRTIESGEVFCLASRPGADPGDLARQTALVTPSFVAHYQAVNILRRAMQRERKIWSDPGKEREERARRSKEVAASLGSIRAKGGRSAIVYAPNPSEWATRLVRHGFDVGFAGPLSQETRSPAGRAVTAAGSLLDGATVKTPYDLLILSCEGFQFSGRPEEVVANARAWVREGGHCIVEVLRPESPRLSHWIWKLPLFWMPIEERARLLVRARLKSGLLDAMRALDWRLPRRFSSTGFSTMAMRSWTEAKLLDGNGECDIWLLSR